MPTAAELAAFLGLPGDAVTIALATEHLPVIANMVKAYVRGTGEAWEPNEELAAVITTATARLLSSPEQIPYDSGSVSMRGGFNGFNLAELAVLNRYRVRAR